MNLRAIVATVQTEQEAIAIVDEIFKNHSYVEFYKIDGCQVTAIYEPDQDRLDRLDREAQKEQAAAAPMKKPAKKLTIEDLEAKVKQLGLDKDLFVTVTAWRPDKPQEYTVCNVDWNLPTPAVFKSKSAIAISRKLTKISKERQAAAVGYTLAIDPSRPIDIQKVCPHCDRPLEKGEVCCVYSLVTGQLIVNA